MISYCKVWTKVFQDEWFLEQNCLMRGFFLQLIIIAKTQSDDGHIRYKNVTTLTNLLSIDRRTGARLIQKCIEDAKLLRHEDSDIFHIEVPKYKYWQGLKDGKAFNKDVAELTKLDCNYNYNYKQNINKTDSPHLRFKKWIDNDKNKLKIKEFVETLWYWGDKPKSWVKEEIKEMEAWVIGNPVKGNKKNWLKFTTNWLKRSYEHDHKNPLKNPLSSSDEQKHYDSKKKREVL